MANVKVLIPFVLDGVGLLVGQVIDEADVINDSNYPQLLTGFGVTGPYIEATTDAIFRPDVVPYPVYVPPGYTSGWQSVRDTQYTTESPFAPTVDVWTALPNDGLDLISTQLPVDVTTFYSNGRIQSASGDALVITVEAVGRATSGAAVSLAIDIDIGAASTIYRRDVNFTKGSGVDKTLNFTLGVYTLDTWEANGALFRCKPDHPIELFNIRYVIQRTHKAR